MNYCGHLCLYMELKLKQLTTYEKIKLYQSRSRIKKNTIIHNVYTFTISVTKICLIFSKSANNERCSKIMFPDDDSYM